MLAVSGGIDSMALLHAAVGGPGRSRFLVATLDHNTGLHSARAVGAVRRRCAELGVRCVTARATKPAARESDWREERWRFLRGAADSFGGAVVTAHTLDDQIETVFMRILRDAGPRGIAGMFAESDVIRPLLGLRRADIRAYVDQNRIQFVDDPTNVSRAHLRNRVRHDLLPSIERLRPSFAGDLLSISRSAAHWRSTVDELADEIATEARPDGSLLIARAALAGYDAESLRALWPALVAKAKVFMDRRGTHRLAEFTIMGQAGGSIQLSGGIEVRMFRDYLLVQRWDWRRVEAARGARERTSASGGFHL